MNSSKSLESDKVKQSIKDYTILGALGKGSYGDVVLAINNSS